MSKIFFFWTLLFPFILTYFYFLVAVQFSHNKFVLAAIALVYFLTHTVLIVGIGFHHFQSINRVDQFKLFVGIVFGCRIIELGFFNGAKIFHDLWISDANSEHNSPV